MTRLARAAGQLAAGSRAYTRRLGTRAAAWCARGRRGDLTGWKAALGPIVRALGLIIVALIACLIVRKRPWLIWLATSWWAAASWRSGREQRPTIDAPPDHPPPHGPDDVRTATLEWIWRLVGDTQGVHLRDLLEHAQAHGMFEDLDVSTFRGHLERWEIPVRKRVRVRGKGITVGIHRDDLPAPSSPSPAAPSQEDANSGLHAS